jgi:hypothetical protein
MRELYSIEQLICMKHPYLEARDLPVYKSVFGVFVPLSIDETWCTILYGTARNHRLANRVCTKLCRPFLLLKSPFSIPPLTTPPHTEQ